MPAQYCAVGRLKFLYRKLKIAFGWNFSDGRRSRSIPIVSECKTDRVTPDQISSSTHRRAIAFLSFAHAEVILAVKYFNVQRNYLLSEQAAAM